MGIQWDEEKRNQNLQDHEVDFEDIEPVFDDPHGIFEFDQMKDDEERYKLIGSLYGIIFFVSFTYRGNDYRIISARKGTKHEQRRYYEYRGV